VYRKAPEDRLNHPQHGPVVDRPQQNVKLTDQYMALLVVILTKAGLCEVCQMTIMLVIHHNQYELLGSHIHARGDEDGV
jgi:hypothetical protein